MRHPPYHEGFGQDVLQEAAQAFVGLQLHDFAFAGFHYCRSMVGALRPGRIRTGDDVRYFVSARKYPGRWKSGSSTGKFTQLKYRRGKPRMKQALWVITPFPSVSAMRLFGTRNSASQPCSVIVPDVLTACRSGNGFA